MQALVLEKFHIFLDFVLNLSPTEITILAIILALLILYLVHRYLGLGAVLAVAVIYAIAYVIYNGGVSNFYNQDQVEKNKHEKELMEAMQQK